MKNNFSDKNPSSRPLKVGEMLRQSLSAIFMRGETHEPTLDNASITVSEVRVAPDLKNATAYIMPLAGSHKQDVLDALIERGPYIRHLLSKKVDLRYMPRIQFKLDASFEEAERVNKLLKNPEVVRDLSDE